MSISYLLIAIVLIGLVIVSQAAVGTGGPDKKEDDGSKKTESP